MEISISCTCSIVNNNFYEFLSFLLSQGESRSLVFNKLIYKTKYFNIFVFALLYLFIYTLICISGSEPAM